ncbi:phosphorylase [Pseudorhodoplanes sp.]|uniref:phosphorylase n=1 Tax=Pseudorhodoplanes sp. TaxID=1934341 RepID=UPI002C26F4EE|nr:phosphorylase [Pseudorhodoplanes sp.]HWV53555.1 phosphorylase [Pseudorhodoplanes sp.]
MRAPSPVRLLVVTGLQREAQVVAGDAVITVCSGGNPASLRRRLAGLTTDGIGAVLSFGLAGGLAPHLKSGDLVIASRVVAGGSRHDVHAEWHGRMSSFPFTGGEVHRGAIAGHDSVVAGVADKASLHKTSGAIAVDMESHIAADFARSHGLPFAVLRAISDPAHRSLPPIATDALTPDGDVDLRKVIAGLLRQPGQLPALIAAGIDSGRAFRSLRRSRGLLGPLLGFLSPHL